MAVIDYPRPIDSAAADETVELPRAAAPGAAIAIDADELLGRLRNPAEEASVAPPVRPLAGTVS